MFQAQCGRAGRSEAEHEGWKRGGRWNCEQSLIPPFVLLAFSQIAGGVRPASAVFSGIFWGKFRRVDQGGRSANDRKADVHGFDGAVMDVHRWNRLPPCSA
jgi:hypothetical protein